MTTKEVNEEQRLWAKYYKRQNAHTYHDRHWLWQIFPEIFPIPPGRTFQDCYCKCYSCYKCGKLKIQDIIDAQNIADICPHIPIYASLFDPNTPTDQRRGLTVTTPKRDFSRQKITVLEVGSGAGATVSPLAEKNAEVAIVCGDFCQKANRLLKGRPHFDAGAISVVDGLDCTALALKNIVQGEQGKESKEQQESGEEGGSEGGSGEKEEGGGADEASEGWQHGNDGGGALQQSCEKCSVPAVQQNLDEIIKKPRIEPPHTRNQVVRSFLFNYVLAVFLLSALPPDKTETALDNLHNALAPGGTLLIYDYAIGDFKEAKFSKNAAETRFGLYSRRGGAETAVTFFNDTFFDFLRQRYSVVEAQVLHSDKINRKTGETWRKSHILVKIAK